MYQLEYPWLLILLPLPLLAWLFLPPHREVSESVRLPFFDRVAAAAGIKPTAGSLTPKRDWPQAIVDVAAWGLILLALARPQFIEPPIEKTEPQRDIMLALDLSQSMNTRDFRAPDGSVVARVEAVRKVVGEFVAKRPGDRLGLIAFGDAPYPLVPFTMDHGTVRAMIDDTLPGIAGPRTSLGDAIGLAIKMFDKSDAPEKVLIVLTDGNDTASKMPPLKAAGIARQNGITVHAVGIGDPNATGEDKLDTATLKQLASTTGGQFFFGEDQAHLQDIYETLDRITPENHKTFSWRPRVELFHYPLGAAVLLLLSFYLAGRLTALWQRRAPA